MTCIVAWKHKDNKIILAGDKMGSNLYTKDIVKEPKIFKKDDFYIGYTTSFRMGQILKHIWTPPKRKIDQTTDNYIYVDVVNSLREVLKENGFGSFCNSKDDETGNFILIYEGRIFEHQQDLSILEHERLVESCGCGEKHAKAAISALLYYEDDIKKILDKTYEITSFYSSGVSKEYDYIVIDYYKKNSKEKK